MDNAPILTKCNALWEPCMWVMLDMHDNVQNRAYIFKIASFSVRVGLKGLWVKLNYI